MGFTDAQRAVLNRHMESAKGDHLSTVGDMEVVEGAFCSTSSVAIDDARRIEVKGVNCC
jgi:hypothetical protein